MKSFQIPKTCHVDIITPLLTDFYQITMAYSYFKNNRHEQPSSFELFFRNCPFKGEVYNILQINFFFKTKIKQYAICAGLHEVISFIHTYKIPEDHIQFLSTQIQNIDPEFQNWLRNLNCSKIQLYAQKEGSICFAKVPLLRLEGPIGLLQLLETPLLNLMNFATLISTNACRIKREAGENAKCLEFGLRRAQGPDGGLMASQFSYLGGFDGSSNVLAGIKYKIPISGTMAHSFITSYSNLDQIIEFEINGIKIKETTLQYRNQLNYVNSSDSELAAFLDYAKSCYNNFTCLIDTFDTISSGIQNFICVSLALIQAGINPKGVRLDSGDLAKLSIQVRQQLDELADLFKVEQFKNVQIIASNDLNQESIKKLNQQGHKINVFGVGTNLVTCQNQPALGGVYKLVELNKEPKHKLSQDAEKSTLPGCKNVYRIWTYKSQYPVADVISKSNQEIKEGQTIFVVNFHQPSQRYKVLVNKVELILNLVYDQGQLLTEYQSLQQCKQFCQQQQIMFNQEVLNDKQKYMVLCTIEYYQFFQDCNEKIIINMVL
ncbi:nicotinate family protein, putative [Ichthyophthirius multifiliis]|uniref:Nicotinate phosphoribosyltransferase n=1 Tax=Ichthyophthirius multifiliis TaxID=5932 RepID=G0QVQ4_ICHMU|nr:nicotinate family protein, putative [Ichthyophthirius multifiliis]EGR30698.1 nicotinate family protein, putative [Ichthyophthirius multifiliis]|eukprot:XP_004032285.1 nicotinate family protein, putative [Ichthyophthirius multifiliis]